MTLQGHPRSLILAPVESAYMYTGLPRRAGRAAAAVVFDTPPPPTTMRRKSAAWHVVTFRQLD